MSYIPTEWQTGDIVTAEKLNKLEEGVASGGGGGGGAIILYPTLSVPAVEGLPDPLMPDADWEPSAEELPIYASYEANGDALTYAEMVSIYEAAVSGTPVVIKTTSDDIEYSHFITKTGYCLINEVAEGYALIELLPFDESTLYIRYVYNAIER